MKLKIIIINGPNLNLLGIREKSIYGQEGFENYFKKIKERFPETILEYYQSNVEGELINKLHDVGFTYDAIIMNAGGYTHTSVAIADAIAAIAVPVLEVHISNIYSREDFRHKSFLSKNCVGIISGLGLEGYALVVHYFVSTKASGQKEIMT
jgi:3-dehydroquinate dehydratase II